MTKFLIAAIVLAAVGARLPSPESATHAGGETPSYQNFADAFDHDDPAGSEARLRGLEVQAHAAGNRDVEAEILTQIARSQGLEMRFLEARHNLDLAAGMAPHAPRVTIRVSIERGRIYRLAGDSERARICFAQAFELARAAGETYLLLDAVHMIALNEPFERSVVWVHRGLAIAAQSRDVKTLHWVAILNNNLGVTYLDRHDYAHAVASFEAALAAYQAQHADAETIRAAKSAVDQARRLGRPRSHAPAPSRH